MSDHTSDAEGRPTGASTVSRRQFLGGGIGAAGITAVVGGLTRVERATASPAFVPGPRRGDDGRPNFLILMVDEMRHPTVYESAALQSFRRRYLHTQSALRATGLEFHRHYVASVACAPSRASIWTGHYPSLHGVTQTDGAAKGPVEPDLFWLDPNGVPTLGNYLRAGGYRTFWKGKWHVAHSDLLEPGTQDSYVSYDVHGNRDATREGVYLAANRLDAYGFDGWIGPEPHGSSPYNSGSSRRVPRGSGGRPLEPRGRDEVFASQVVDLIASLDGSPAGDPWLIVASFVNPHDIALWGLFANLGSQIDLLDFDFSVEDVVPKDLFNALFTQTENDNLETKPSCQKSARDSYRQWMQPIFLGPPYQRFYYQLHKNVDEQMFRVYQALSRSRFFENTIVIFTSDHGDFLGSHGGMHQKWYTAYEEAVRVPFIISNPRLFPGPRAVEDTLTSHIDVIPTILGLAGLDSERLRAGLARTYREARPLVGRDLSGLVRGTVDPETVSDPVFFMTDDDMSRGLDQSNFIGIAYESVVQPNHIETVIARLDDGKIWKYSRYFDNPDFWSDPGRPGDRGVQDVVLAPLANPIPNREEQTIPFLRTRKIAPLPDEREMYVVSDDPMELVNLAGEPAYAAQQQRLSALLDRERAAKRLKPGETAGSPSPVRLPRPLDPF